MERVPVADLSRARRGRPHQELCRLRLRRRVLHQHRHGDGASPADHHGLHVRRPGTAAQIRLSDKGPNSDEACFKNPKFVVALSVTNDYPGGFWEDYGYNWFSGS